MLLQFLNTLEDAYGSQQQIVNEQEQNREVNAGALTQPDTEKVTDGSLGEAPDSAAKQHTAIEERRISQEEQEEKSQQK